MLDQINAELATRLLARKRHYILDTKRVLTVRASHVLVVLLESPDYVASRDMRARAVDHLVNACDSSGVVGRTG
jgi:hypothetical protein